MSQWEMIYNEWNPGDQPLREALCAVGNGLLVTRAADETRRPGGHHYPGTYIAGMYDRAVTRLAGHDIENEDLVNWPNWLFLTFRPPGGEWIDLDAVDFLEHEQRLDMRRGLYTRTIRYCDDQGRITRLVSRRVVSMADPHLTAIEWQLTPENWEGRVELRSEIDGRIRNRGVERYRALEDDHFAVVETGRADPETVYLVARTHQSRIRVACAARLRLELDGRPADPSERRYTDQGDRVGEELTVELVRGLPLRVEKIVAIHTSRDLAISEPALEARKHAARAPSMPALFDRHRRAWQRLWDRFDLHIEDDEHLRLLRLHLFHLLQTVCPNSIDRDAGVPARGWHGEAYRGHILWDELFIFSLLNLRTPELTRALLIYRCRRLDEARAAARAENRRGAKYPWQSGSDGREESQSLHLNPRSGRWIPDHSHLQRHINLAIAYNIWQYYEATADRDFLATHGAEVILEVSRYLVDRAEFDESGGRFHIRGVMGPDEFHEQYPGADEPGLDDNAYTNIMTAWLLARTPRLLALLGQQRRDQLREDLELTDEELDRFDAVSRRLHVPFHADGIISQFEGYEHLEELDWDHYRATYDDIGRLDRILESEGKSPSDYKLAKQADALMILYLLSADELVEIMNRLGYEFTRDRIPPMVDYYQQRTSHGSTLSRVVHAWVLARADREGSWNLFAQALRSDIDDIQGGTTPEGIHLGAMAGTVDLIHRGYTGLETRGDILRLNPRLPRELPRLQLSIRYRGRELRLDIDQSRLTITADDESDGPLEIEVRGSRRLLQPSRSTTFDLERLREQAAAAPPAHSTRGTTRRLP